MDTGKESRIGQENASFARLVTVITTAGFSAALVILNRVLDWEFWMVPVICAGAVLCIWAHIAGKSRSRAGIYSVSLFLIFEMYYYTVRISTLFDSTALIAVMLMIFAFSGERGLVLLGTVCGFAAMGAHLLAQREQGTLVFSAADTVRAVWQLVLILVGGLLAGKLASFWENAERQYLARIRGLQDANAHANSFLASVSHEICLPVGEVIELAGQLGQETLPERARRSAAQIRRAGQRAADQVGELMDITQIGMKELKIERAPYRIAELLRDLLMQLPLPEESGPELVIDLAADVPAELTGDGDMIRKIIRQLLSDSFRFTESGGVCLRISAKKREYGVNLLIAVTDTGAGMTAAEAERLCDRLYRPDSVPMHGKGGLGLGIPIVSGIARAMNGFLHLESTPRQGTAVTVSIPQEIADPAPCIRVFGKEGMLVAGFLSFLTTDDPRVKEFYTEMIDRFVTSLGITFHRVLSKEALDTLRSEARITHLFVGTGEYLDYTEYIDSLAAEMQVVLVEDRGYRGHIGAQIAVLKKPFTGMQIADILSGIAAPQKTAAEETASSSAADTGSDLFGALRAFGVDVDEGLQYCRQDTALYRRLLAEYAKGRREKLERLAADYRTENWADYAILVHSVKSTAKMIGADALSEQARTLEHAAKAGDAAAVTAGHGAFAAGLTELLELLCTLTGESGEPADTATASAADADVLEFKPKGGGA